MAELRRNQDLRLAGWALPHFLADHPELRPIAEELLAAGEPEIGVLLWLVCPSAFLDGDTPLIVGKTNMRRLITAHKARISNWEKP